MNGLAAAAALLLAVPAGAVTITSYAGAPDPGVLPDQALVVSFDAPDAAGIVNTVSGAVITAAGSIGGVRAAPAGDATAYQSIGSGASSTFDFLGYAGGKALGSFSLYWGSIDGYNHVDFYNRAGDLAATYSGSNLPRFDGTQTAPSRKAAQQLSNICTLLRECTRMRSPLPTPSERNAATSPSTRRSSSAQDHSRSP